MKNACSQALLQYIARTKCLRITSGISRQSLPPPASSLGPEVVPAMPSNNERAKLKELGPFGI